jgi:integrase
MTVTHPPTTLRRRTRARAQAAPHRPRPRGETDAQLDRELARLPPGHRDWKLVVSLLLKRHNAQHSTKHKGVSGKTMHDRESFYFAFFDDLRMHTPYRRVEPRRLRAVHVDAIAAVWAERGLSAGTVATYLSYLRTWCQWTGRAPQVVRDAAHYYGEDSPLAHRRQAADRDRSWVAAGIAFPEVRATIEALCPYVAMQTEFCRLFGVRAKEARCLRPHEAVVPREAALPRDVDPALDATHYLRLDAGTKGGRPRDMPITTEAHRALIARAQALVGPGQHLGRPGYSLKANTAHFYAVLARVGVTRKQLGVTAHGLRHEFGNDAYERHAGTASPVRGGLAPDRARDREARTRVSRLLGHNRPAVASCYLGSPRVGAAPAVAIEVKADQEAS